MSRDTWTIIGGFIALGALLLAQYNGISSRFDSIDGRLVAIESRLTEIETRLSSVAERVSYIEGHLSIRPSVEEERQ